jgi:hydrogenase nickel incorporation protein HypA/HybF
MHESGLTEDLFTHAMRHAQEAQAKRITRVKIRIGALSDASPESIQFYFNSLAPGTIAEGAALEFVAECGTAHCNACGRDVKIDELFAACPSCGEVALTLTGGDAVYLDSLDVET